MSNKSEKFKDTVSLLVLSSLPAIAGSLIGHTEYGTWKAAILGGLVGLVIVPYVFGIVWSAARWLLK